MLIIYAHPNKKGHCGYVLSTLENTLKKKSESCEILDLYAENYDPAMSDKEHYSSGGTFLSPETKRLQNLLEKHDTCVVIYPVWWGGVPAILKGFFDKVLTPPFAFKYENGYPKGMLSGRKAFVFATSGAPADLVDSAFKTVTDGTFSFCGFETTGIVIGQAAHLDDSQKNKIETAVKKAVGFLL